MLRFIIVIVFVGRVMTAQAQISDPEKIDEIRSRADEEVISVEKLMDKSLHRAEQMKKELKGVFETGQALDVETQKELFDIDLSELPYEAHEGAVLYIFISESLPDKMISQYLQQSANYDAVLVYRGFAGGSLTEMAQKANEHVTRSGVAGGMIIDPKAFEVFAIDVVPAIVLAASQIELCLSQDCVVPAPRFDKVTGSVSVEYALELFQKEGDLSREALTMRARAGAIE